METQSQVTCTPLDNWSPLNIWTTRSVASCSTSVEMDEGQRRDDFITAVFATNWCTACSTPTALIHGTGRCRRVAAAAAACLQTAVLWALLAIGGWNGVGACNGVVITKTFWPENWGGRHRRNYYGCHANQITKQANPLIEDNHMADLQWKSSKGVFVTTRLKSGTSLRWRLTTRPDAICDSVVNILIIPLAIECNPNGVSLLVTLNPNLCD